MARYIISEGLILIGGTGEGRVSLPGTSQSFQVNVASTITKVNVTIGSGNDTLGVSAGDDSVNGGGGNDSIFGFSGNDSILGGAGNDTIDGGEGDDTIFGQAGDNCLSGGNGNDLINGGDNNDTIDGGDGSDTLVGLGGNDSLNGGNNDDTIIAGNGNDTLIGGEGNDVLRGGSGDDSLIGGSESDLFKIEDFGDFISDFDPSQGDRIELLSSSFPGGTGTLSGLVTVFTYFNPATPIPTGVNSSFSISSPTYVYNSDNGTLILDRDGILSGLTFELIAQLPPGLSNFIFNNISIVSSF